MKKEFKKWLEKPKSFSEIYAHLNNNERKINSFVKILRQGKLKIAQINNNYGIRIYISSAKNPDWSLRRYR